MLAFGKRHDRIAAAIIGYDNIVNGDSAVRAGAPRKIGHIKLIVVAPVAVKITHAKVSDGIAATAGCEDEQILTAGTDHYVITKTAGYRVVAVAT